MNCDDEQSSVNVARTSEIQNIAEQGENSVASTDRLLQPWQPRRRLLRGRRVLRGNRAQHSSTSSGDAPALESNLVTSALDRTENSNVEQLVSNIVTRSENSNPLTSSTSENASQIPDGIDPSFLAALPEEMRDEVIAEHLR